MSGSIHDSADSQHAINQYLAFEQQRSQSSFSLRRKFLVVTDKKILCCSRIGTLWHRFLGDKVHFDDILEFCKTNHQIDNLTILQLYKNAKDKKSAFELVKTMEALAFKEDQPTSSDKCSKLLTCLFQSLRTNRENSEAIFIAINEIFKNFPIESDAWCHSVLQQSEQAAQDALQQNIIARYRQILSVSNSNEFESLPLTPSEAFRIAYFIETKISNVPGITSQMFKQKDTTLPRTLQYSASTKTVYLLAKPKISKLQGIGASKRVVTAASLALNNYQISSLHARVFTQGSTLSSGASRRINEEFEITKFFWKKYPTYFLRPHTISTYSISKPNKEPNRRISIIIDSGTESLYRAAKKQRITQENKEKYARNIVKAIQTMHKEGYLHLDFKPQNILIDRNGIKIIDLETARPLLKEPDTKKASMMLPSIYDKGYHATAEYTAPELFKVKKFSGDYSKVEMFAVGVTLWETFFGRSPPWINMMYKSYRNDLKNNFKINKIKGNKLATEIEQFKVKNEITIHVETPLKKLLESKKVDIQLLNTANMETLTELMANCTKEEKYAILRYQLLRWNPNDRWSAEQAGSFCDKFLN